MSSGEPKAATPRPSTQFFDELGPERCEPDRGGVAWISDPAYLKSVSAEGHAPQAIVCADVFHLVKLVGDALDEVRRELWQNLRRLPDDRWAKAFKGARWALLKNPEDLTDAQAAQLARIRRTRGGIWRAYEMKEQFRAIFAGDVDTRRRDRSCSTGGAPEPNDPACAPFIKVAAHDARTPRS